MGFWKLAAPRIYISFIYFLVFQSLVCVVDGNLDPFDAESMLGELHPEKNVVERGLVTRKYDPELILQEHSRSCIHFDKKNTGDMPVMGFLTPWNSKGYEYSLRYYHKFTHFSPVWYDIVPSIHNQTLVRGDENMNTEWLKSIEELCEESRRSGKNCTRIVPRVAWRLNSYSEKDIPDIVREVREKVLEKYKYDGIVFEVPTAPQYIPIIKALFESFQSLNPPLEFIVVASPLAIEEAKHLHDFLTDLVDYSTHLMIMTYDASAVHGHPGTNAPWDYYEDTVQYLLKPSTKKRKMLKSLMMGIPFYGYDEVVAIISHDWLKLIKTRPLTAKFSEKFKDDGFSYTDEEGELHYVTYPSLIFIQYRLNFAKKYNTGVAIWEIGQGLEYWFDLL